MNIYLFSIDSWKDRRGIVKSKPYFYLFFLLICGIVCIIQDGFVEIIGLALCLLSSICFGYLLACGQVERFNELTKETYKTSEKVFEIASDIAKTEIEFRKYVEPIIELLKETSLKYEKGQKEGYIKYSVIKENESAK
jgi:hypothetical protein